MTAAAASLLQELRARGIYLAAASGGAISLKAPPGTVGEDDRRRIGELKPGLLRLLRREAAAIPPTASEADLVRLDAALEAFDGMEFRCARHGRRVDGKPQWPDPEGSPAPAPSVLTAPASPPVVPTTPLPTPPPLSIAEAIEEAHTIYLTRLGIAMDQDMPTEPGCPAELIAWREAMTALVRLVTRQSTSPAADRGAGTISGLPVT